MSFLPAPVRARNTAAAVAWAARMPSGWSWVHMELSRACSSTSSKVEKCQPM